MSHETSGEENGCGEDGVVGEDERVQVFRAPAFEMRVLGVEERAVAAFLVEVAGPDRGDCSGELAGVEVELVGGVGGVEEEGDRGRR